MNPRAENPVWLDRVKQLNSIIDNEVESNRAKRLSYGQQFSETILYDLSSDQIKEITELLTNPEARKYIEENDPELKKKIAICLRVAKQYQLAYELGDDKAMFFLGEIAREQEGNSVKALDWYQKSYTTHLERTGEVDRNALIGMGRIAEFADYNWSNAKAIQEAYLACERLKEIYFSEALLKDETFDDSRSALIRWLMKISGRGEKANASAQEIELGSKALSMLVDILFKLNYTTRAWHLLSEAEREERKKDREVVYRILILKAPSYNQHNHASIVGRARIIAGYKANLMLLDVLQLDLSRGLRGLASNCYTDEQYKSLEKPQFFYLDHYERLGSIMKLSHDFLEAKQLSFQTFLEMHKRFYKPLYEDFKRNIWHDIENSLPSYLELLDKVAGNLWPEQEEERRQLADIKEQAIAAYLRALQICVSTQMPMDNKIHYQFLILSNPQIRKAFFADKADKTNYNLMAQGIGDYHDGRVVAQVRQNFLLACYHRKMGNYTEAIKSYLRCFDFIMLEASRPNYELTPRITCKYKDIINDVCEIAKEVARANDGYIFRQYEDALNKLLAYNVSDKMCDRIIKTKRYFSDLSQVDMNDSNDIEMRYSGYAALRDVPLADKVRAFEKLKNKSKLWSGKLQSMYDSLRQQAHKEYVHNSLSNFQSSPDGLIKIITMASEIKSLPAEQVQTAIWRWIHRYGSVDRFAAINPMVQEQICHRLAEFQCVSAALKTDKANEINEERKKVLIRGDFAKQASDLLRAEWRKDTSLIGLAMRHNLFTTEYNYLVNSKNYTAANELNKKRLPLIAKMLWRIQNLTAKEHKKFLQDGFNAVKFQKEWLEKFANITKDEGHPNHTFIAGTLESFKAREDIKKVANASMFTRNIAQLKKYADHDNLLVLDYLARHLGAKNPIAIGYALKILVLSADADAVVGRTGIPKDEVLAIRKNAQALLLNSKRAKLSEKSYDELDQWLTEKEEGTVSPAVTAAINNVRNVMKQEEVRIAIKTSNKPVLQHLAMNDNLLALHELARLNAKSNAQVSIYIKIAILTADETAAAERFGLSKEEVAKMHAQAITYLSHPPKHLNDHFHALAAWGLELAQSSALKDYANIRFGSTGRFIPTDDIVIYALHNFRGETLQKTKRVQDILDNYKEPYIEGLSSVYPLAELDDDLDVVIDNAYYKGETLIVAHEDEIEKRHDKQKLLLCSDKEWKRRMSDLAAIEAGEQKKVKRLVATQTKPAEQQPAIQFFQADHAKQIKKKPKPKNKGPSVKLAG